LRSAAISFSDIEPYTFPASVAGRENSSFVPESSSMIFSLPQRSTRLSSSFRRFSLLRRASSSSVKGFASFFGNKKLAAYPDATSFTSHFFATCKTCSRKKTFIFYIFREILLSF